MRKYALQAHLQAAREIVSDTSVVFRKFWAALGRCRTITKDEQWFQKDGSIPHISSNILLWLRQRFEDRFISMRCDVEWAPHSPDLTPADFYLWGYLKDRVYDPDNRWLEHSNYSHDRGIPHRGMSSCHWQCCAGKCACNAKGAIWNTFMERT